ncbi:MAG: cupin domain-containing protein [Leptolyngbyaceae cyanobacterium]
MTHTTTLQHLETSVADNCKLPVIKTSADYQVYRISPEDRNRLAIVFDPKTADVSLTYCVEIFEAGGQTPAHRHNAAVEMFYVLKVQGEAVCDGKVVSLRAGDSILIPNSGTHLVRNVGRDRLYMLCIMVPNEDFAELIRNGIPDELDEEDLRVLNRTDSFLPG